jgi:glycosyltransferase involved in cell wall biosynthesis
VPDITVVIPSKNRGRMLRTTLEMALGQDDVDHEVIVVDDGSTDDTPATLTAVAEEDPRLRFFRHEQSRGVGAARNRGLQEARGEWVGFMDDDDLWAPYKLRVQLAALRASGALFAYGQSLVLDEDRSTVTPDQPAPDPEDLHTLLLSGNVLPGGCSNVLVRTEAAREVGGFDERLSMLADWDMWLMLSDKGAGVRCPEIVVAYRKHASNMSLGAMLVHRDPELTYFASKLHSQRGASFDAIGYSHWLAEEAPSPLLAARIHARAAVAYRAPSEAGRALWALLGGRAVRPAARRVRAALRGGRRDAWEPEAPTPVPDWLEPHRLATER